MPRRSYYTVELSESFDIDEVITWFSDEQWQEAFANAGIEDYSQAQKCTACGTKILIGYASNLDKFKLVHCPVCLEVIA